MTLLKVDHLTTQFQTREGVFTAVDDISFEVEPGQVLGIVGESGSGKSVCCYSLLGLVPSPPGKVAAGSALFDGVDLLKMNSAAIRAVRGNRIGMIFQDPMTSLNPHMTIAKQLMEPVIYHKGLNKTEARKMAIKALIDVGIRDASSRIDSFPHEFSGGMRQRVMIAMALINEPELLIADEPTTALDVTIQAQILDLLKSLQRSRNLTIIFISHDLAVVGNIADHILVMKQGQVVESGHASTLFSNPKQAYTRQLLDAVPKTAKPTAKQFDEASPDYLCVSHLHKTFVRSDGFLRKRTQRVAAVKDVSLRVKRGEILGLVGESGSGKSTLGRCMIRLLDCDSGSVVLGDQKLYELGHHQLRAARRDFQMIFQDPYASLNPRMTVFDCLAEPILTHKLVPKNAVLERVNQLMDEVGLARNVIRKYPHEFSGGQRQRIAIARALAMEPKLIVADEPVSALDVTIQAQVLDLLLHLSKKLQLSMVFISHDLSVVRYIADRVAVMKTGEVVEYGEAESVFGAPTHPYTQQLVKAVPAASWLPVESAGPHAFRE